MRKVTTILRQIDELEKELYNRFSTKEIYEALNKENKKREFYGGTTGLISVIRDSVIMDIELEEIK